MSGAILKGLWVVVVLSIAGSNAQAPCKPLSSFPEAQALKNLLESAPGVQDFHICTQAMNHAMDKNSSVAAIQLTVFLPTAEARKNVSPEVVNSKVLFTHILLEEYTMANLNASIELNEGLYPVSGVPLDLDVTAAGDLTVGPANAADKSAAIVTIVQPDAVVGCAGVIHLVDGFMMV